MEFSAETAEIFKTLDGQEMAFAVFVSDDIKYDLELAIEMLGGCLVSNIEPSTHVIVDDRNLKHPQLENCMNMLQPSFVYACVSEKRLVDKNTHRRVIPAEESVLVATPTIVPPTGDITTNLQDKSVRMQSHTLIGDIVMEGENTLEVSSPTTPIGSLKTKIANIPDNINDAVLSNSSSHISTLVAQPSLVQMCRTTVDPDFTSEQYDIAATPANRKPIPRDTVAEVISTIEKKEMFHRIKSNSLYKEICAELMLESVPQLSIRNFIIRVLPKRLDEYVDSVESKRKWKAAFALKTPARKKRTINISIDDSNLLLDIIRKAKAERFVRGKKLYTILCEREEFARWSWESVRGHVVKTVLKNLEQYALNNDEIAFYKELTQTRTHALKMPAAVIKKIRRV